MIKIGILTFHKSINYGSVLQTWALCQILNKYDVTVIDYEPTVYKESYGLYSASRGLKQNVNRLINTVAIRGQIKGFSDFRNCYLDLSGSFTAENINADAFKEYNAIITGSDHDTDFSEARCDDRLKEYILDYDFISIREKSGADKVSRFIDNQKEVYTMLDPTLLNTKETYDEITSKRIVQEPYIFL